MTTYTIDDTSPGTVIPGPAAITKLELITLPASGYYEVPGALTLVDNFGYGQRQVYNIDSENIGRVMGLSISQNRFWFGVAPVMSATPIPFTSLLIESVPRGSQFQLEVN
jgi:hypothetical protein